jgi:hypothetical protein
MDIDTSSYPKAAPVQQQNPLDTISKLQGIQQQSIGIDRAKLQLLNDKWDYSSKVLGGLLNTPDLTSKHIIDGLQDIYKNGGMDENHIANELSSLPTAAAIRRQYPNASPEQVNQLLQQKNREFLSGHLLRGASKMEQLNWYARGGGIEGPTINNGQVDQLTTIKGGNVIPIGPGFQREVPPTAQTVNPKTNQPQLYGAQGEPITTIPNPRERPPLPVQDNSFVVNPARNAEGRPNNLTGEQTPISPSFNNRFNNNLPEPKGPMTGAPPSFEEGKRQYAEDINKASATLQAVKPAQQALKLIDPEVIKGLSGTGPIAEKATKVLAALQGIGLLNTTEPVAQRQELVKKLNDYVSRSAVAQRSDAAQTLKEASSPNANVQVLPALLNLTRDAIALDRVDAAKSLAFTDKDFSKYLPHKGSFPNNIDERAFKLDLMPDKEREETISKIEKENPAKVKKFRESYQLAKRLKMYE